MPEPSVPFPPLDIVNVRRAVADSLFADVRYVARTGSTNDDAAALLGSVGTTGITIVADEQTAGKGRRAGRSWIAARGSSLLFTAIVPTAVRSDALWAVPFWAALGVADGIQHACGVQLDLRWPNDGFLAGRKAVGILCTSRVAAGNAFVACGIGVNVYRPVDAPAIDPPPAFLSDVAPHVTREALLAEMLLAFERRMPAVHAPDAIARTYEERAGLAGARYRLRLDRDGSELDGIARGLGADGALRLEANGSEHLISLADARRL